MKSEQIKKLSNYVNGEHKKISYDEKYRLLKEYYSKKTNNK